MTKVTTSTTEAYIPDLYANDPTSSYNVYWYNLVDEAFGFAPQSVVKLDFVYGGDTEDLEDIVSDLTKTATDRLSWSLMRYVIMTIISHTCSNIHNYFL